MRKTYLPRFITFSLLFLITIQADAKHNFSNPTNINDDNILIIYNEINGSEVILRNGNLIEGNLLDENKSIFGEIIGITKTTINIGGEQVNIEDIRRIRKKRTQGNRVLKIAGLIALIGGAGLAIAGLSGFPLFAGILILGLVIAFQSKYIRLDNPDVKIEVKEL